MSRRILFFIMCIFMISSVYALGVSPGRTTVDFEPGLSKEISFEVINSESKDMKLLLSAQGELAEYISSSTGEVSVSAGEGSKTLSYTVNLPNDLEPGLHTVDVLITEIPNSDGTAGSVVLATLAVATQLYVHVPYPGKFAEADLIIYNADVGSEVRIIVPITSRGEFDLTSVRANIDIYNGVGDKVDSFNTKSIAIPSGEKKELVYDWKADVPIGNYRAAVSVIYDEGTIPLEAAFSVGSRELELQEINVNNFRLGEIAKLEMLVENKWSEPISDAHIETRIKDDKGDIVSSFESANYDILALAKQTFVSYWDTSGVKVGDYQAEISINYGDKSSMKNLQFQVSENDLQVFGLGYVISAEGGDIDGDGGSGLIVILIVVIVVLVLINLLWFLLLRKRLKK